MFKERRIMANSPTVFSAPQRTIHWLTVILVLFNLILPGSIERVVDLLGGGKVPTSSETLSANLHIYSGIAILTLTVLRLALRAIQGVPEKPADEPDFVGLLAKASHALFYAVLIAMPALGIAKYFFDVDAAGDLHGGPVKLLLWALIGMHVLAVLVHQFWWRTNILARMTTGQA